MAGILWRLEGTELYKGVSNKRGQTEQWSEEKERQVNSV